jgi:AraC family transcriptional regulator, regulatory protein of adaptative response / DNA-3-methyladenine glycosylase II
VTATQPLDPEACYRAVSSRDRRFDGVFWTAVSSTGIYCRPSCPARTPAARNVTFHPSAASAQAAGYRACKRCLPDATPGSPDWDSRADLAGRAMRLISDGVVDRDGVEGLADRLGYTSRHLGRLLIAELGAGPLALARARRAQTARVLIESSDLSLADVAFASGFSSVRQFNETLREVYATTPSELRRRRVGRGAGQGGATNGTTGTVTMRLAVRTPFAGGALLDFLAVRAVPGVETVTGTSYARTLRLPHSWGTVQVELVDLPEPGTAFVTARFGLADLRDTAAAVERVRRLLDADCDPVAVDTALGADPLLAPLVAATPGLRVPGHVDGAEIAIRAVLGQQITVAAARTLAGRLVAAHGTPIDTGIEGLTHLFCTADVVATVPDDQLAMPRSRARALRELAARIADGRIDLSRGSARADVRRELLAVPGIGPWTADYVAMRALGDPDVFLPTDIGVRDALARFGDRPEAVGVDPDAWQPWRSYALIHLWRSL